MSVVGVPVASLAASPGDTVLVTQALLGEPVLVLEEQESWLRVALPWQPGPDPRGYLGWVRSEDVTDGTAPEDGERILTLTRPSTRFTDGEVDLNLSFGTRLRLHGDEVVLPDGRRGRVAAQPPVGLLDPARQLLGLPYLWGGLSAAGLDCSGLVHLSERVQGRRVPRDAADQCAAATPVDPDLADPEDVYFFAHGSERVHHVGYATSRPPHQPRSMLHTSRETGLDDSPMSPERLATLLAAGRWTRTAD